MQGDDEQVEAFISELKQWVISRYPEEVWKEAVRDQLTTDAREYIRLKIQSGDVAGNSDLDFFAEVFFQTHEGRLKRFSEKAKGRAGENPPEAKQQHGSLQSILTYTMLLPKAIRLRQKVLGDRMPLSYQDAVTWLRGEANAAEGEPMAWLSFGFTIKVPGAFSSKAPHNRALIELLDSKATTPEACGEFVAKLLQMHIQSEYELSEGSSMGGYMYPDYRTELKSLALLREREFVTLGHAKLVSLADAAERLLPEANSLDAACWLILTGLWRLPPMRVLGGNYESGPYNPPPSHAATPQRPLTLEVAEWATAPEALADYFRDIKQHYELPSRTRQPTFVSEVIALCAIEVSNLHDIYAGDAGYYPHVLGLFEERALEYGIDPFADFASGSTKTQRLDAIRKVLKRIEKLHQEYYANTVFYKLDVRSGDIPPARSLFRRP